jgi:hypothetical protein
MRGASGQSTDITQWQDSTGATIYGRIDQGGNAFLPTLALTSNANPGGIGFDRFTYSRRAQDAIMGGGNIIFDASANFSWSSRFIVIAQGNSATSSTNGYFDITMPAAATAVNVAGGAAARNWTASGILLNGWEALWYVLPIGSGNASVPANFWVTSYTAAMNPPGADWILLAVRNGDDGTLRVCNGLNLQTSSNVPAGARTNVPALAPFHLGGQVPVAVAKPKFVATRTINFTTARYWLEAGTMTPAIYVNGANVVQGTSLGAGPLGGVWNFSFTVNAGDRVQVGATAADATAAEFSVTLEGFAR